MYIATFHGNLVEALRCRHMCRPARSEHLFYKLYLCIFGVLYAKGTAVCWLSWRSRIRTDETASAARLIPTMKRLASPVPDNQTPQRFEIHKKVSRANGFPLRPQRRQIPFSPTELDRDKKKRHRAKFPKSFISNSHHGDLESSVKSSSEVVLVTLDGTRIKTDRASACTFSFVQAGE